MREDPPVATLNVSITAAGEIHAAGVAIECEHAEIMLPELERLMNMLREHACGAECSERKKIRALQRIS